jgi:hypothetical protein
MWRRQPTEPWNTGADTSGIRSFALRGVNGCNRLGVGGGLPQVRPSWPRIIVMVGRAGACSGGDPLELLLAGRYHRWLSGLGQATHVCVMKQRVTRQGMTHNTG